MAQTPSPAQTGVEDGTDAIEPTTVEKLRGLRWSIASNAGNTVFVQYTFFGSIFILFLSALGLSKAQMGYLLSLLPFFGLIALFVAPLVARWGFKRTYIVFFGLRDIVAAGLLLTPFVVGKYGSQAAFTYVGIITATFAMFRAVGVTANFPWVQQYVPNNVRGKYTATNNIFTTTTGFIAVAIGGLVLARTTGLTGFMVLITVGVAFGLISVGLANFIPGGAPVKPPKGQKSVPRDLKAAATDRNFIRYLTGVGLITLVTVPLTSFLPLFMREQVGLDDGGIVLLQTGTLVGALLSSYLWGWAADRYGSVPVTLSGLSLRATLPILWMLMPRNSEYSLYVALVIAFLQGVADMGWGIGSARLLFVKVVPPDKRTDYMAFYYAWIGIVGGVSQLSVGRILDSTQGLTGQFGIFTIDQYLPLFLASVVLPFVSFFLLRKVQDEESVGIGQFAGIFLRGNPFLAMSSMMRYYLARDERAAVRVTERLGRARSPLTVDELLEALEDPRYNVRFEAVISISRMPPDRRLRVALVEVLDGSELALSAIAAWALGRMADAQAIEPLRETLDSDYRSIRAQSARALGALGDREVIPELILRLDKERDKGLAMAYASALGKMMAEDATPQLLHLLYDTENRGARMELALSLARIVGDERNFIRLLRSVRVDAGTALSQGITAFQRKLGKKVAGDELSGLIDECADQLARENLDSGEKLVGSVIRRLPLDQFSETGAEILAECAGRLDEFGSQRTEYVILALHILTVDWQA